MAAGLAFDRRTRNEGKVLADLGLRTAGELEVVVANQNRESSLKEREVRVSDLLAHDFTDRLWKPLTLNSATAKFLPRQLPKTKSQRHAATIMEVLQTHVRGPAIKVTRCRCP